MSATSSLVASRVAAIPVSLIMVLPCPGPTTTRGSWLLPSPRFAKTLFFFFFLTLVAQKLLPSSALPPSLGDVVGVPKGAAGVPRREGERLFINKEEAKAFLRATRFNNKKGGKDQGEQAEELLEPKKPGEVEKEAAEETLEPVDGLEATLELEENEREINVGNRPR